MQEESLYEELVVNGDYGIIGKDTDFIFTEGDLAGLPKLFKQDDEIYEYNQAKQSWSVMSCTIFNPVGAVSDLMNYKFPLEQIKEIDALSYEKGRKQGDGWRTDLAVDLVRNWWNSNKELVKKYGKIASYRLALRDDALIADVLSYNYTICGSYQGNSQFNNDRNDGVLDNYEFGKSTYGHSVGMRNKNNKKCVKDNYAGRTYNGIPTNIFEVRPERSQLVTAGTFRPNCYLFTKVAEDNYDELIRLEKVKVKCHNALKANSELWENTNDKELKDRLHKANERIRNNNLKYIEEHLISLR